MNQPPIFLRNILVDESDFFPKKNVISLAAWMVWVNYNVSPVSSVCILGILAKDDVVPFYQMVVGDNWYGRVHGCKIMTYDDICELSQNKRFARFGGPNIFPSGSKGDGISLPLETLIRCQCLQDAIDNVPFIISRCAISLSVSG